MHALIVEDEPKAATFLCNGLSENGWAVDVAGDGRTALEFLQEKTYDIVLLDVLLPSCDGWSVIRRLRRKVDHPFDRPLIHSVYGVGYVIGER